jgi:hypothetical protein
MTGTPLTAALSRLAAASGPWFIWLGAPLTVMRTTDDQARHDLPLPAMDVPRRQAAKAALTASNPARKAS